MRIFSLSFVFAYVALLDFVFLANAATPWTKHSGQSRRKATESDKILRVLKRQSTNPTDHSWVKKWAAIGDSFTAGIGAGRLYKSGRGDDSSCSRYDHAYPVVMNRQFGNTVEQFLFPACSGARSAAIYDQAVALPSNLDLVTLTAGGNDLCLAAIIATCIFAPALSDSTCNSYISTAQANINNILKNNVKEILETLETKVKSNGAVVLNSYAEFFNTETDDCEHKEDWSLIALSLPLTKSRRIAFNQLVIDANTKLKQAVNEVKAASPNFHIGFSDWSKYPKKVGGQYCDPDSSGRYPDPRVPDLQFFKGDSRPWSSLLDWHMELRRREVEELSEEEKEQLNAEAMKRLYTSSLYNSPNPQADALHRLDKRAPATPSCPGDGSIVRKFTPPDFLAKRFHPNEKGHNSIAGFAIAKLIQLRADVIDAEENICSHIPDQPNPTCNQKRYNNRHSYVSVLVADWSAHNFCVFTEWAYNEENVGDEDWNYVRKFNPRSPDEHVWEYRQSNGARFDYDTCRKRTMAIVHGCDGHDEENPLNFKFGGVIHHEDRQYKMTVTSTTRPLLSEYMNRGNGGYYGSCKTRNLNGVLEWTVRGAGWMSYEQQDFVLKKLASESMDGFRNWKFEYFKNATARADKMEWEATFRGNGGNRGWIPWKLSWEKDLPQRASGGTTFGCTMAS